MHGEWKRGNITPTVGDSVEKRSDTQKLIDWYKTWKTGTIVAWGRVDVAPGEMSKRSYGLSRVVSKAVKATKRLKATSDASNVPIHELTMKGQWSVVVQDLVIVNEGLRKWKYNKNVTRKRCTITPKSIFIDPEDEISTSEATHNNIIIGLESHDNLIDLWAAQQNDNNNIDYNFFSFL